MVEEAVERARSAAEAFAPVAHLRNVRRADPARLERLVAGAESLDETLRVAAAAAGRLEAPLAERTGRLAEELRGIASREAELRRAVSDADARALAAERRANGRTAEATGEVAGLRMEAEDLSARAAEAAKAADDAAERARTAARALADADPARTRRPTELVLEHLLAGSTRLEAALAVDVDRFEAPVRERAEAQAARTTELGASLRTLGAAEVELRQVAGAASEKLSAIDVELARTDAEREEAQRRLDASGSEPIEGEDRDELAEKLARYEKRREQLGQVNPLAKEEYDAEKVRLEELSVQRADLEKSLAELEKLRDDLTRTVETRFAETFEAVEKHFHEVAATLFPGGEGRLRLTEAEEDGDEPGHRGRAAPGRQARHAALAALRRREGARRDRVPVLPLPRAAEPVLSPRRGRGGARRHEHRTVHRAAAHAMRTVRSSSSSRTRSARWRRPTSLRRDDGERWCLPDRLAAPAARRRSRRDRVNDLAFVERAVLLLESKGVDTWVFGGWAEELRGLIKPREHVDVDLLYPAEDWSIVDNLYLDWVEGKHFDWKRAFRLEGITVELFLVQYDARGWYTQLERRRHNWPANVFSNKGRLPVVSTAALAGYRHSYRVDARDVA